uniref:Uncharacterized protein n=1 Tax=Arundo donax TaxID=35708 RepID=A0A0A9FQR3_ARUDO
MNSLQFYIFMSEMYIASIISFQIQGRSVERTIMG